MERTFRKTEEEYPQKIFAHQLITISDLEQFKKQLLEELLLALKKQTVYSGETDHVIPWQTDQGFNWRTEVVNAVEVLSKVVV